MQFHVTEAQEQDISILWSNDAKKRQKKSRSGVFIEDVEGKAKMHVHTPDRGMQSLEAKPNNNSKYTNARILGS
jgi:hypothetical protein